ncbi:MAG: DUF4313 domain-containing protein [Bacilli bacterium]
MSLIIGLILILLVFFLYSACVLASRCSRKEELSIKSLNFNDEELYFEINNYSYNNRLAILCYTEDEPFSDITINLPNKSINSYDEGFIDPINKDCGLYQELINCGIIKEVIEENVSYNMGKYDLVRFDMNVLKEFDPKGYENYLSLIGYEEDMFFKPSI